MQNPDSVADDGCRVRKGASADARLEALGMTSALLLTAVRFGLQQAFTCNGHYPPTVRGIYAWGSTIAFLRQELVPDGWNVSNEGNYATVIHPNAKMAVAVAAGDANTGSDFTPRTRSAKGSETRNRVRQNHQISFAEISDAFPRPVEPPAPQPDLVHTWLLLHHVDEDVEEIHSELSLPAQMDRDGYVCRWSERIILDSQDVSTVSPSVTNQVSEEIDVPLVRRHEQ